MQFMVLMIPAVYRYNRKLDEKFVPAPDQMDLDGLDARTDDVAAALAVDVDEWRQEIPLIEEWFAKIGDNLPSSIRDEFEALKQRLGA